MSEQVRPIPEGYHSLTPHLVIRGAAKAIDYYKEAFGAQEIARMPTPDGERLMHAEVKIGDSILMLADEFPEMGGKSPEACNGTPMSLLLYVEDVDTVFDRAIKAGGKVVMQVQDMFWGDRYGKLVDPFGHEWSVATHVKDLSEEEMIAAGQEACKDWPEAKKAEA